MPHENPPTPPRPTTPLPRSKHAREMLAYPHRITWDAATFPTTRGRWAERFDKPAAGTFDDRIIFEIGCADGALLADVAARHPTIGFVGLDWKVKAIVDAAARLDAVGVPNVHLIRGRAQELRALFGDGELAEIWIFHPDPCDRDVERPNRLVSDAFLRDAHAVLRRLDGRLCLKTDHAEYAQSVRELFAGAGSAAAKRFDIAIHSADFWADAEAQRATAERPFAGVTTRYEARFRAKRTPIHYFELRPR